MIESISVTNYRNEELVIDLRDPYKTGFAITKITGLGPSKADINTTEVSTNDGSTFNMARLTTRNIVISLDFVGNDIETLRQKTYKYFPIKKDLKLVIKTSNREASITGYVESNEANIFSSSEGTNISIICPNPYFYSVTADETTTTFSGIEPIFEFEFSNESLDSGTIEFSVLHEYTEAVITYNGDSEIGITITIHALGPVGDITLYNILTRETLSLSSSKIKDITGSSIMEGDVITISTVKGNKYVGMLRHSIYTNIINALDRNSDWPQLSKGDNVFSYTASYGIENVQMSISNDVIYEGI